MLEVSVELQVVIASRDNCAVLSNLIYSVIVPPPPLSFSDCITECENRALFCLQGRNFKNIRELRDGETFWVRLRYLFIRVRTRRSANGTRRSGVLHRPVPSRRLSRFVVIPRMLPGVGGVKGMVSGSKCNLHPSAGFEGCIATSLILKPDSFWVGR